MSHFAKRNKSNQNKSSRNNAPRKDRSFTRTMNVRIIETERATDAAIKQMQNEQFVGFDCEGIVTLGRSGKVSLIQISTQRDIYLFDIYKMNFNIPRSLSQWLSNPACTKFIHDSRQDQDALYHRHGIALQGIFDTTVADLVHRTWVARSNRWDRLKGMEALAYNCIHDTHDYKVNFMVEGNRIAPVIKVKDLRQKSSNENDRDESETTTAKNGGEHNESPSTTQWKKLQVNIFDGKQNTKLLMQTDRKLWARRPIPENLVVYAAQDAYISLLLGQYYRRKFKDWMMSKTLLVSAKWCNSVARHTYVKSSSAKVPLSIYKLLKADTSNMSIANLAPIDELIKYKQERDAERLKAKLNGMDISSNSVNEEDLDIKELDCDNLLLLARANEFMTRKMEEQLNGADELQDATVHEYVSDVYKLKYDINQHHYTFVGQLNYQRLVPLTLLEKEFGAIETAIDIV